VKRALTAGRPVISVDTKKKELVGNFANAGQQWLPAAGAECNLSTYAPAAFLKFETLTH
jgi:hypothetical protein